MFERTTDRARRTLALAAEEAFSLHHNYIGCEHLLLGILREGENIAAKALDDCDVKVEQVRNTLLRLVGSAQHRASGNIPLTPRAKKALELALRQSLHFQHSYIGPEHIMLGILQEGKNIAIDLLEGCGIADPEVTVRKCIIEHMAAVGTQAESFTVPRATPDRSLTVRILVERELLNRLDDIFKRINADPNLDPFVAVARVLESFARMLRRLGKQQS